MADDVTITAKVEGIQQALSDMQLLQAQIEKLAQSGGGGGAYSGGGGSGGGGTGVGGGFSPGVQATYQAPPPFTPATPGGGTAPGMGAPTTYSPHTQSGQPSEADRVQSHLSGMVGQMGMNMAGTAASFSGFGMEFQAASGIMQLVNEIRVLSAGVGVAASAAASAAMGAAAVVGGASLGVMTAGHLGSLEAQRMMVRHEPAYQERLQYGHRAELGMTPDALDISYFQDIRRMSDSVGRLEQVKLMPGYGLVDAAGGGFLSSWIGLRERQQRQEMEERAQTLDAQKGLFLLTSLGVNPDIDLTGRRQEFGRNVAAGRRLGIGARSFNLGAFETGHFMETSEAINADITAMEMVAADTNQGGGFDGGIDRHLQAAMGQALISGDTDAYTMMARRIADRMTSGGDEFMSRAAGGWRGMAESRGAASLSGARRSARSARVRAADSGLGSRDAAVGILAEGAGDWDAQISLLESQLAVSDNTAQQEEIRGRITEARVAQRQARGAAASYGYGLQGERLGIAGSGAELGMTLAANFGGDVVGSGYALAGITSLNAGRLGAMSRDTRIGNQEDRDRLAIQAAQEVLKAQSQQVGGFQMMYGIAGSAGSVGGAEFGNAVAGGYGFGAAVPGFSQQVGASRVQADMAEREIAQWRLNGYADNSPQIIAARGRAAAARGSSIQAGNAFASQPLDSNTQMALEAGQFAMSVSQIMPGMYGTRRELLGQQMELLGGAYGEIDRKMQAQIALQGYLDPSQQHIYQQQQLGIRSQQAQVFAEMSHGWQSRLLSEVVGAPGSLSMLAPGQSFRAMVGAGVRNPLFGSWAGDVGDNVNQAMMLGSVAGMHTPAGLAASALQGGRAGAGGPVPTQIQGVVDVRIVGGDGGVGMRGAVAAGSGGGQPVPPVAFPFMSQ